MATWPVKMDACVRRWNELFILDKIHKLNFNKLPRITEEGVSKVSL